MVHDVNNVSLLTVVYDGRTPFAAVYSDADAALMADAPDLLNLLDVYASAVGCSFVGIENWHKARALIAKHRGGV